ncbi:MAG: oligoendopeptidase F [Ignavibacteria bacterium]
MKPLNKLSIISGLTIMGLFSLCFQSSTVQAQDNSGKLITRTEIDKKYTWNLDEVYANAELWEKDFKWVEDNLANYKQFEGKLGLSADELLKALKFDDEISIRAGRLFLYASLAKDLDLSNTVNSSRSDKISSLWTRMGTVSAFMHPEILSIPDAKIAEFLEKSDGLKLYKQQLDDLFRTKKHALSKEQEELLALSSDMARTPHNTFGFFDNAEAQFPTVKDPQGNDIEISHGRYGAALYSADRDYRERVYMGYYKPFKDYKNTITSLFNGNLNVTTFYAKARKYNSAREAALDANNIPVSVYDNLVKTVDENLKPLHRWVKIKKRVLGYKEMHMYDMYVTLFPGVDKEYSYESGRKVVIEALKPMGQNYITDLKTSFDSRWVDVYETKGKRSGAYSNDAYGAHPFVLLNWNNQLNDVFTLAHEMGHNMHSFYTQQAQPYPYGHYSIFVAEVASTANEALLLDYLIEHAQSKDEKLSLLEKYVSNIVLTFYRQTGFAEFEQNVHDKAEKGEPLSSDKLCGIYRELVQRYYGPDMIIDDEETYTWIRVPHFYTSFYVYQYATGLAASQALVTGIKEEGTPAVERYLSFLKAGSSDYPINVLKKAGVDMNSPEPVLQVIKKMNKLLNQMEKLLDEK